jgi:1-acyl-sn-glycerol-3-phosphate acyltransferase
MITDNAITSLAQITFKAGEDLLRFLRRYHDHEVYGFENVPRTGPALMAFHHSLATYDSFLLGPVIKDEHGRLFRGLADRMIFSTPGLGKFFSVMGFVNGTREGTLEMLRQGEIIGFAPGGMREALRSSRHKYQLDWKGRFGFVWVSMLSGAPVVLAACPKSDDIYDVTDNPVTPWVYDRLHLPIPLFRGRGMTPLPRPVKLWHLIAEPIFPDVAPDQVTARDVEAHHARLSARMERLMQDALTLGA